MISWPERRKRRRKVGAVVLAAFMLFAGIANAYCSVDKFAGPGALPAVSLSAAHDVLDQPARVPDAGCDAAVVIDEESGQPGAEWQAAVHAFGALSHVVPTATPAHVVASFLIPIPEPVVQRFPRLLI